jgi:adenylosuccinate lyase
LKEGTYGYDSYLSPFTWRYGSPEMKKIFSETQRRASWRRVWLSLAEAEAELGLISSKELEAIRKSAGENKIDIAKAHDIERRIKHDLMAELRVFADQAKEGGGKLHLGATSMDIEDNADLLIFVKALDVVLGRLVSCLDATAGRVRRHKGLVCMGWTHLQPAEPTTMGYRFANYAQDLVLDIKLIDTLRKDFLRGKGIKGAVGTSASFRKLLGSASKVHSLEQRVMSDLGLGYFDVSMQTYPRKLDYLILTALASVAASCAKFGLDLRILQSPTFGELSEPIEQSQVGSSAMPFKRNPVTAERMCSLARVASVMPLIAFMNASNSILERTLDDSAARRISVPEAFLAVDECLAIYERLMRGLRLYPAMIEKNLERFGVFAGTEAVMMELVEKGADRQATHELIRVLSFAAWESVMKGKENPLERLLSENKRISSKLTRNRIKLLLNPLSHAGYAKESCDEFLRKVVTPILASHKKSRRPNVEY